MNTAPSIVVVEDEPDLAGVIQETLEDEGYLVTWVDDGQRALALLSEQTPDLVLLDLRLPGLSGTEILARYRTMPGPQAPVVIMTASTDAERAIAAASADGVLAKPFDLDQLVDLVARYAGRPEGG